MIRAINILAVLAIVVVVCGLVVRMRNRNLREKWNTEERISALWHEFRLTSIRDEGNFARIIGTGIIASASSLPQEIWGTTRETATNYIFRDVWGQPLQVKLSKKDDGSSYRWVNYELLIWSIGRNRINEFGNGDDILGKFPEIDFEIR